MHQPWRPTDVRQQHQIRDFLESSAELIAKLEPEAIEAVVEYLDSVRNAHGRIYVAGNGGSAATASHLVSDLAAIDTSPRFMSTALSDNTSIMTAIANDFDYESVFSRQLEQRVTADDMLIVISCSGNSPNILKALRTARAAGATTIGLLGCAGEALRECDHAVAVDSTAAFAVEGIHSVVTHAIATALRS